MSKGDNTPGVSRLAGAISKLADKGLDTEPVIDFGGIQADGSLLTNSFPIPIPKSDYQVCRYLTYPGSESNSTTSVSVGDHGSHSHSVSVVRDKDRRLRARDRLLVVWVGSDAVVVDVIIPA